MPDETKHPYQLVMRKGDRLTRIYAIIRAEELVIEHYHPGEHLDRFFPRLTAYLNRDQRPVVHLEQRVIDVGEVNRSLHSLLQVVIRKLAWCADGMKDEEKRYVAALVVEFRKTMEEIGRKVDSTKWMSL